MDAAHDGRPRGALRGWLDTGGEHERKTAPHVADVAHRLPDEFYSALRCSRTKEQVEPPQCDDEPHGPEAGGLMGENHPKLPHGWADFSLVSPSIPARDFLDKVDPKELEEVYKIREE